MTVTPTRLRELIRAADDRAADSSRTYEYMQRHRDIAAALRELQSIQARAEPDDYVDLQLCLDANTAGLVRDIARKSGVTPNQAASVIANIALKEIISDAAESGAELSDEPDAEVEHCESDQPECGPVTRHDSHGVPLCEVCWNGLLDDAALSGPADKASKGADSPGSA